MQQAMDMPVYNVDAERVSTGFTGITVRNSAGLSLPYMVWWKGFIHQFLPTERQARNLLGTMLEKAKKEK